MQIEIRMKSKPGWEHSWVLFVTMPPLPSDYRTGLSDENLFFLFCGKRRLTLWAHHWPDLTSDDLIQTTMHYCGDCAFLTLLCTPVSFAQGLITNCAKLATALGPRLPWAPKTPMGSQDAHGLPRHSWTPKAPGSQCVSWFVIIWLVEILFGNMYH